MENIKKLAWLGDPGLKEEVLLRMKQHRAEDSIVQGLYQQSDSTKTMGYRGCLLGCTLPKQSGYPANWHGLVQRAYGIPISAARLVEIIFENLDTFEDAAAFAVDSIEAIPVGADLSRVRQTWENQHAIDAWRPEVEKDRVLALLRNAPVPGDTP